MGINTVEEVLISAAEATAITIVLCSALMDSLAKLLGAIKSKRVGWLTVKGQHPGDRRCCGDGHLLTSVNLWKAEKVRFGYREIRNACWIGSVRSMRLYSN